MIETYVRSETKEEIEADIARARESVWNEAKRFRSETIVLSLEKIRISEGNESNVIETRYFFWRSDSAQRASIFAREGSS